MSLTGDELSLNNKKYCVKDKYGNYFYLGKLLKREKSYSPFHRLCYSLYNNIFLFENMPNKNLLPVSVENYYNKKIFFEVDEFDNIV